MSHSTKMVPPIPIKASVQPNVQVSIVTPVTVLGWWADLAGLIYDGERLFRFNRLTWSDLHFFQGSGNRRDDGNFHLHRFHNDNDFVLIDMLADLFFNF